MTDQRASLQTRERAQALVDAGAVEQIPGTQYIVKSGENTYRVLMSWDHPFCTCAATGPCKHQEAVRIVASQEIARRAA